MKILAINQMKLLVRPTKTLDRKYLQASSGLKDLFGGSVNNPVYDMIIPGGLSKFEKIYYEINGKYPKSVQERWFLKGSGREIMPEDYEVKIGPHLSGDPFFEPHSVTKSDSFGLNEDVLVAGFVTNEDSDSSVFDDLMDFFMSGD